jgi:hypothetical protein
MIRLDDNFYIDVDTYNYTLKRETKTYDEVKDKVVTSKEEWHYPKLSQILDKYLNMSLKACENIVDLRVELTRIEKIIQNIK